MTAPLDRRLAAVLRSDFSLFVMKVYGTLHPGEPPVTMSWYLQAMCHALNEVAEGRQQRLVISVPPRHLKSITATVAHSAWMLGRDPTTKIMVACYSQDLSRKHAHACRQIMESKWYQALFPGTRIDSRENRALELGTTAGGVRKAVSVEGTITGFGADVIILDDCMKPEDVRSAARREDIVAWYEQTVVSRLNNKATGKIVSIQQRIHEDDLPARLLEKGFAHLNLPSVAERQESIPLGGGRVHTRTVGDLLDPERHGTATLEYTRRQMGPVAFSAQYQQNPVAPEGNLIRMEWFGTYEEVPERHELLKVVQSWDTALSSAPSSDWSVCTTWGFERDTYKWHLLDVYRQRLDYPHLKEAVLRLHRTWKADAVLIEDAGSGKSLFQDLRNGGRVLPVMIRPDLSKEERFVGCLGEVEAGHILLPAEATWLAAFCNEIRAFPHGRHDDQVDSFSQFVNYQLKHWKWILTEYDTNGRARELVRRRERPW